MVTKDELQLCESITEEEAKLLPDTYKSERKMDGERIIAVVKNGQVALLNRRGYSPNKEFQEVTDDLKFMPNCILDGEVIDFTDTFNILQRRAGTRNPIKQAILRKEIPVKYMVFDILQVDNQTITSLPLSQRQEKLKLLFEDFNKKFVDKKPFVELTEMKPIKEMLELAHKEDREGIVIKNMNAPYESRRSKNWLKCKFMLEKDLKMTKYTINPKGIRVENDDEIAVQIAGEISQEAKRILDAYKELTISIRYLEETITGKYRFPSFKEIVYTNQIYKPEEKWLETNA